MPSSIPSADDNAGIVQELKRYVGNDRILLSPVAFGVRDFVQPFEQALREGGVDYIRKDVMHRYFDGEDYTEDGKVRPRRIAGFLAEPMEDIIERYKGLKPSEIFQRLEDDNMVLSADDIGTSHGARWWVFYDDDSHIGRAGLGVGKEAVERGEILGVDYTLLVLELDILGIAHVSRVKKYLPEEYMGLKNHVRYNLAGRKGFKVKNLHLIAEPLDDDPEGFGVSTSTFVPNVPTNVKRPGRSIRDWVRGNENWFRNKYKERRKKNGSAT